MGLSSQVEEEPYEVQTATATGASATTGKVRAASPTCCFLSTHELEVAELEVKVEG